jgi:hypothetical protein
MVLPDEASFSHAISGAFYRGAHYRSDLVREELAARYKAALMDAGLRYDPVEDFLRTGDLGGDVIIRVTRSRRGGTTISIGSTGIEKGWKRLCGRRRGAFAQKTHRAQWTRSFPTPLLRTRVWGEPDRSTRRSTIQSKDSGIVSRISPRQKSRILGT